jgi:Domain of unknown function (DUF397)
MEDQPGTQASKPGPLAWRKSARSIGNGQCVQAARAPDGRLAVRDSADRLGAVILFAPGRWRDFLRGIKSRYGNTESEQPGAMR